MLYHNTKQKQLIQNLAQNQQMQILKRGMIHSIQILKNINPFKGKAPKQNKTYKHMGTFAEENCFIWQMVWCVENIRIS